MKIKSFVLVLGLVFVNTLVYAGGRNALPAFKATLTRKVLLAKHVSPRTPRSLTIPPGNIKTVSPYEIPRQRFTVLGNISNGTFIMNPITDTPKVISPRPRLRDDWWAWENKLCTKLPDKFTKSKSILFRGISINNLAELENLLRNGSQINKTSYREIYFSSDLSDALFYMIQHIRFSKRIPVLITVKSSYDMDYDYTDKGNEFPSNHFYSFDTDIPAQEQEIFAYLYHNGKNDWYHVSLTEQGKIITQLLSVYFKEQKAAKPDTNNKADMTTDLSEYTSTNP